MHCTAMRTETKTMESIQSHGLTKGKLYEIVPNDQYRVKYQGVFECETPYVLFFRTKSGFYISISKINHFLGHEKIKEVQS